LTSYRRISPTDYYNLEVAAGMSPQSVCDELNNQNTNEDRAYKDACGVTCGGKFTLVNILSASSMLVYRTNAATSLDNYLSSVILQGSVQFPCKHPVPEGLLSHIFLPDQRWRCPL